MSILQLFGAAGNAGSSSGFNPLLGLLGANMLGGIGSLLGLGSGDAVDSQNAGSSLPPAPEDQVLLDAPHHYAHGRETHCER